MEDFAPRTREAIKCATFPRFIPGLFCSTMSATARDIRPEVRSKSPHRFSKTRWRCRILKPTGLPRYSATTTCCMKARPMTRFASQLILNLRGVSVVRSALCPAPLKPQISQVAMKDISLCSCRNIVSHNRHRLAALANSWLVITTKWFPNDLSRSDIVLKL